MKRKFRLNIVFLLCTVMLITAGCQKKPAKTNGNTVTKEPDVTVTVPPDVEVTGPADVPAIDIGQLEKLNGIALTANDRAHNIYRGTFGEEEVILSLWIDKEQQEAQISFVGAYHSDKLSFSCELLENGIRYQDNQHYILLRQQKEDTLTGYFYENGSGLSDVKLNLEAVNYSEDKEHLYQIGTNEEVETFAQKVLDAINGADFEAFSNYIAYPITIRVNQATETIENKEKFLDLGSDTVFTDEFQASMAVAYANIMFANGTDGVMLGDGQYNVWINKDQDGKLKVISINN